MSSSTDKSTFMDLYGLGRVTADDIDDFVDRWHEAAAIEHCVSLPDYLGMTPSQYEDWVRNPASLPKIARDRMSHSR